MDDLLSRVTIDPIAIKYPARGETASAGLAAQTSVSGCLGNLDGRVIALDGRVIALEGAPAPAPSGNYDVTVATALVAADVGKVVVVSSGTASIYQGGAVPAGVLVSVDGNGGGVVRRRASLALACRRKAGLLRLTWRPQKWWPPRLSRLRCLAEC